MWCRVRLCVFKKGRMKSELWNCPIPEEVNVFKLNLKKNLIILSVCLSWYTYDISIYGGPNMLNSK